MWTIGGVRGLASTTQGGIDAPGGCQIYYPKIKESIICIFQRSKNWEIDLYFNIQKYVGTYRFSLSFLGSTKCHQSGLKSTKIVAAGALLQTPLGNLTALPRPLADLGEGMGAVAVPLLKPLRMWLVYIYM